MHFFPNQNPQIGVLRSWTNAPRVSSLHSPSITPLLSTCTIVGPTAFLRRHKKSVNSALLIVCCTSSSPAFRASRALAPSPRRDQAAPPTIHTRSHLLDTPNNEPSIATWFPKPSTGKPQLFCFSDSHLRPVWWHSFHWPSLKKCDVIHSLPPPAWPSAPMSQTFPGSGF